MGRSAVKEFWVNKINELTENFPKLGPKAVSQRFEKDPECATRDDWPSESAIGRYQRKFRQKDPAERAGYRYLRWPESMQGGALAWEASSAALELLRRFRPSETGERPTIRLARWFWHVSQAAPDAPDFTRRAIAARLALAEVLGDARQGPAAEAFLIYRAWTSEGWLAQEEAQVPPIDLAALGLKALSVQAEAKIRIPSFPKFEEPVDEEALGDLIGPEAQKEIERLRETLQQKQEGENR